MDKYYYLVAQLPLLFFDKEPALSREDFLDEARKWLNRADYRLLARVNINDPQIGPEDHATLVQYKTFEIQLREELLNYRQARDENMEYKFTLFPANVVKEGNPLEVEKKLLRLRWEQLAALEFGHHFDLGFLIIYHLRLQIWQRLDSFDKEIGMQKFNQYTEVEL